MSEPNNLEATVFVFEHNDTGEIKAFYAEGALEFGSHPDSKNWKHVASLEPRLWIQTYWRKAMQDGRGE